MKKLLSVGLSVIAILLLVWVNLPGDIPLKFNYGSLQVDTILRKPSFVYQTPQGEATKTFDLKLGLDLQGGSSLIFEADTSKLADGDVQDALESARDIIERRVNLFGIAEPNVRTIKSGDVYRIAVELPGVEDVSQAVGLIGSTAQLSFREEASAEANVATDSPILFPQLEKETGLTGTDVRRATVVFSQETGEPQVQLEFTSEGTQKFADITRRNVGKPVGIFLDQFLLSGPIVQQPILDGNAVITGNFTVEDAKQLVVAINSGALPLPIALVEQRSIGPTLGQTEVTLSVFAGVAGILMVMLFMVLYYGRLGLIACGALLIYGLISMAIFRAIPIVLTLPGIAGFILSIGMAVDANILIFERIKEEMRKGREFNNAVRLGFGRAMDAIKDANITTLLVAFILFNPLNWEFLPQFGLVRGFALTLAIGVLISLFTGIVITRRLIRIFYKET
jgi:preprotein translocase subunit SecD